MIAEPDVLINVTGGVADVRVYKPDLIVEVRDYDVEGALNCDTWEDEDGDRCIRQQFVAETEDSR